MASSHAFEIAREGRGRWDTTNLLAAGEWAQKETANGRELDGEDAAEQFKTELEDEVWCLSSKESSARKMSCADSIRGR